ncbi:MAG: hypothetical protein WAK35_00270, partial [Xanthobacteraceae bacterium]
PNVLNDMTRQMTPGRLNVSGSGYSGLVARTSHWVKCATLRARAIRRCGKTKASRSHLQNFHGILLPKYAALHTDCGRRSFRIHEAEWRFMTT